MIKLTNVWKSFNHNGESISILKGLTLNINQGQKISIVGRSGAGKSTLLSLLSGLDHPDQGEVEINRQMISTMSDKQRTEFRATNIGMIFQNFHLVSHLTVFENILFSHQIRTKKIETDEVVQILDEVGLSHRLSHYPHQLSGGEKQRVAVARAIVGSPKIILADEPSGSLDYDTGEQVMKLIFSLVDKTNTTLVLVTHDLVLANKTDKVLNLQSGILA